MRKPVVDRSRIMEQVMPLIRATLASTRLSELTDGELLSRFVSVRDDEAFNELVRRLGPVVLGVCQRILGPGPDAEDAFQVTFMVLVRRADIVRPPGRIAAWLHGVAALTARKARAVRTRRQAHEAAVARVARVERGSQVDPGLAGVLDEELERLPERFRLPLILCEVHELTITRAAVELNWPVGTVASRLSRGRARLAARLSRRGVAGVVVLGAGGLSRVSAASLPMRLFTWACSATGSGGVVPPGGESLLNEVLRAMTGNKIPAVCVSSLVAVVVVVAVVLSGDEVSTATAVSIPATKAVEPKEPLDRVRLDNLFPLLKEEVVKADLGLTAEQNQKLQEIYADAKRRREAALEPLKDKPQVPVPVEILERSLVPDGIDPEFDKAAVDTVLMPAQVRRLKQISIQVMGPAALLDRYAIRALGLTAAQEDQIAELLRLLPYGTIIAERPDGTIIDRGVEKIEWVWVEVLKVLTPGQRALWDAMTGKTLSTVDVRAIRIRSRLSTSVTEKIWPTKQRGE